MTLRVDPICSLGVDAVSAPGFPSQRLHWYIFAFIRSYSPCLQLDLLGNQRDKLLVGLRVPSVPGPIDWQGDVP